MEITLKLSLEEVNLLLAKLGTLAWAEVNPLMVKIRAQGQEQFNAVTQNDQG